MPQEMIRLHLPDVARAADVPVSTLGHYLEAARARRAAEAQGLPWKPRAGDDMPLPSGREKSTGTPLYWGDPGPVLAWARRVRDAGAERRSGRRLYVEDVARLLGVTAETVQSYRARASQRARAAAAGRPYAHQPGDDLPHPDGKDPYFHHRPWWSYETLLPYLAARRPAGRPRAGDPARPLDPGAARRVLRLLAREADADPRLSWPDLVRRVVGHGVTENDIAALYSRPVGVVYAVSERGGTPPATFRPAPDG